MGYNAGAQSPYYRPDSDAYLKKDGQMVPLSLMHEAPPAYHPAGPSDEEFYRQHAVLENLLRLAQCQANNENTAANALELCPNGAHQGQHRDPQVGGDGHRASGGEVGSVQPSSVRGGAQRGEVVACFN